MVQCKNDACRNKVARVLLGVFGRSAGESVIGSGGYLPLKHRPAYLCEYHMKPYLKGNDAITVDVERYIQLEADGLSCNQIYELLFGEYDEK